MIQHATTGAMPRTVHRELSWKEIQGTIGTFKEIYVNGGPGGVPPGRRILKEDRVLLKPPEALFI